MWCAVPISPEHGRVWTSLPSRGTDSWCWDLHQDYNFALQHHRMLRGQTTHENTELRTILPFLSHSHQRMSFSYLRQTYVTAFRKNRIIHNRGKVYRIGGNFKLALVHIFSFIVLCTYMLVVCCWGPKKTTSSIWSKRGPWIGMPINEKNIKNNVKNNMNFNL